jgi:ribosome biogenesis GTPase
MTGLVYKSTGSWYIVKTLNGKIYECRIKGKFRLEGIKSTNPIAVGDFVEFDLETKNNKITGVITRIQERVNYIIRKSVNLAKQTHIIASNIDQVFLLVTINNPQTFTSFIDRFLVSAEAYSIKTILLFNKIDTYSEEAMVEVRNLVSVYRDIGYECIEISAKTGKNIDKVKQLMIGKVSMFSGHSGVGKSTLINALEPGLNLKTKEISGQHQQGQHTTTFAEMYDLRFNAKIIDTPGIKGFGVVDMDTEEVGDFFPEFFNLKHECKFNNCTHIHEPGCAIKKALDNEGISFSRYRSYRQILEGDESSFRIDNFVNE